MWDFVFENEGFKTFSGPELMTTMKWTDVPWFLQTRTSSSFILITYFSLHSNSIQKHESSVMRKGKQQKKKHYLCTRGGKFIQSNDKARN